MIFGYRLWTHKLEHGIKSIYGEKPDFYNFATSIPIGVVTPGDYNTNASAKLTHFKTSTVLK